MSTLDDKYDIEAEVGRGPSACVFKATEKGSSRTVAVKHMDAGDERAKQFPYESEWDKIVALNHPFVVKAIEHIEEDGDRYIVSEFVKGESLEHHIHQNGPIPERDCIYIFRSVAQALNNAHENGLLHLNIRGGNVFLSKQNGSLVGKVGDFGNWTMGIDPGPDGPKMAFFKSPEQRKGSGIMVASDIYALGKLLYVAASGVDDGRITPTALPEQCVLQEIIYGCIRTRMEDRFQSMDEFISALDQVEAEYFSDGDLAPDTMVSDSTAQNAAATDVSVTGQMRADSEVQSMVIACRSHMTNKKLKTSRKVLGTAREAIVQYGEFQGQEWMDRVSVELDEIEDQLSLKERELDQMVLSAEEAYADSRFEDVEMLAAAASEVCKEHTGCEAIAEEARKAGVNIRTFMEDAFTSMKVKDYRRAELDCIKILEISPGHVDALQMRKTIKGKQLRKKIIVLMLKVIPIILIVGIGAGGYLFFLTNIRSNSDAFKAALKEKRGKDAEKAANNVKKRSEQIGKLLGNDLVRKLFADPKPALDFLDECSEARDALNKAETARDRAAADSDDELQLALKQSESMLGQAESEFESCQFDAAVQQAEEAARSFDKLFVKSVLKKAEVKLDAEKWQEAYDLLEEAYAATNLSQLQPFMKLARTKLVPELLIETYVNGKPVKGAYVFINGKRQKSRLTPTSIELDMNEEHKVGVLLPPKSGQYCSPAMKTVTFDTKEAKTMRFDLELIPGPKEGHDWTITDSDFSLKMKAVSAGSFKMGNNAGEIHERPEFPVRISRHTWIGQYEVTRAQFLKVMGGSPVDGDETIAMSNVNRDEALAFCRKLNRIETRKNRIPKNYEYRLPTEAEWEYCSRANQSPPANINDKAWHAGNSNGKSNTIGSKEPNAWGLYDTLGNVAEWCLDSFNGGVYSKRKAGVTDPAYISDSSSFGCVRGGSFKSPTTMCHPAARGKLAKNVKERGVGFRLILAPFEATLRSE